MLVFITESRKSHATLKILTPLITLPLRIYITDEPVEGKYSISLIPPPLALWMNGHLNSDHQWKLQAGGGDKEALKSNELVVAG